jgi:hypothetical protein
VDYAIIGVLSAFAAIMVILFSVYLAQLLQSGKK